MISRRISVLAASLALFLAIGRASAATETKALPGLEAAVADAQALAARHPGAGVFVVEGVSMLPYFGDGAVLVMKPIPSARLRAGMIVVYTNRFGETVAHRVTGPSDAGWQVRGYNNDRADSTKVDDGNLRGVVYAIFHPRTRQAQRTANAGSVERVPVALAAPPR